MNTRLTLRRVGIAAAGLALFVAVFGGVYAATTALNIQVGGAGQQGDATVTGDCQTGALTVTFQSGNTYDPDYGFVYDAVAIDGIDAACSTGDLGLVWNGPTAQSFAIGAIVGGSVTVDVSAANIGVGNIDTVAIALFD